jgi:tetratricopeptide (TPR) repeat protein
LQPELTEPQVDLGFVFAEMKNPETLIIAERILQSVKDPALLSQARFMKAIYYYNRKERQKALAAFNECIVQDYTFLDAYIGKGILLYEQKEYNIASTVFQQAIDISATFAEAWYWLGKCAEAVNNKEKAVEYYEKTLGLDEKFEEAKEGLKRLRK